MQTEISSILFQTIFNIFKETWWFWLFLAIISVAVAVASEKQKRNKFSGLEKSQDDRDLLSSLRKLNPFEFEEYITYLYNRLGFKTETTQKTRDGGVDVVADKDGVRYYIQCKKFITRKVGAKDVREFLGAVTSKLSRGKGIFITTYIFTSDAEKFAEENLIEAIDGHRLIKLIRTGQSISVFAKRAVNYSSQPSLVNRYHLY